MLCKESESEKNYCMIANFLFKHFQHSVRTQDMNEYQGLLSQLDVSYKRLCVSINIGCRYFYFSYFDYSRTRLPTDQKT